MSSPSPTSTSTSSPAAAINALSEFQATQTAAPEAGAEVTLPFDGFAGVKVPAGSLSSPAGVVLTAGLPGYYADLQSNNFRTTGRSLKITLSNGQTQLLNGAQAEITLAYEDADQDGIVDGTDMTEDGLKLARYDQESQTWDSLETTVDPQANTITARTDQFSLFTLGVEQGSVNVPVACGLTPHAAPAGFAPFLLVFLPLALRLIWPRRRQS
jgi:hypothetical protein